MINSANQDFDPLANEKCNQEFCCYCGRSFNSLRGLNTHRRTCFVGESIDVKEAINDMQGKIYIYFPEVYGQKKEKLMNTKTGQKTN